MNKNSKTTSLNLNPKALSIVALSALTISSLFDVAPVLAQNRAIVEEIIVTARRREEQLQDVPMSIQAITMEQMEMQGIERGGDLNIMIPNLSLGHGSASATTTDLVIRGIPNVGIYLDGIWQWSAGFLESNIVEIERVEILRGPQGTLFGRNTNGGAIQYISVPPNDTFGVRASVTMGSYNRQEAKVIVDVPITDTLLTKWSFASLDKEGWNKHAYLGGRAIDGSDSEYFRADLLWQPTATFDARFTATINNVKAGHPRQNRWVDVELPEGQPLHIRLLTYNIALGNPEYGPYDFWPGGHPGFREYFPNIGAQQYLTQASTEAGYPGGNVGEWDTVANVSPLEQWYETEQYSLTANWDITDTMSIQSTTAWREQFTRNVSDFTALGVDMLVDLRLFTNSLVSQEIHLEGTFGNGDFDYLAGFYYSKETQKNRQYRWQDHEFYIQNENGCPVRNIEMRNFIRAWGVANDVDALKNWQAANAYRGSACDRPQHSWNISDDMAVFGELSWHPSDQLSLTFGGRVTKGSQESIEKGITGAFRTFLSPTQGSSGYGVGCLYCGPILSQQKLQDTGAVFTPKISASYDWRPNIMIYASYAEGFTRGEVREIRNLPIDHPDRFVRLDPEVAETWEVGIRSDWMNNTLRFNATMFHTTWTGIRVGQQALIGPAGSEDFVNYTVSAGEGEVKGFESEIIYTPTAELTFDLGLGFLDAGYTKIGNPAVSPIQLDTIWAFTPEWNVKLGAQYDANLSRGSTLTFRADYGWQSEYMRSSDGLRQAQQPEPAYGVLNARIVYAPPVGDNWTVSLFGTNLANKRYVTSGIDASHLWGVDFIQVGPPRQYGITVNMEF